MYHPIVWLQGLHVFIYGNTFHFIMFRKANYFSERWLNRLFSVKFSCDINHNTRLFPCVVPGRKIFYFFLLKSILP